VATILRTWSYQYQWLYDTISRLAAISLGGEVQFHHLPLQHLTISSESKVLDLCCGSAQATQYLVKYSQDVIGLDASLFSLQRAQRNVPQGHYVEALAEDMPFPNERMTQQDAFSRLSNLKAKHLLLLENANARL
jgi:ubiquinone/menaquinone biosynthesis C-methylase UbiE